MKEMQTETKLLEDIVVGCIQLTVNILIINIKYYGNKKHSAISGNKF